MKRPREKGKGGRIPAYPRLGGGSFLDGLLHAWNGLVHTIVYQRNMRVHLTAGILVGLVGSGIIADPFGASFCLVFVALFFARAFYRMDLLTIGDFYRKRYNKTVEVITSVAITASYLGWTSAQLTALGLVFWVLSGGAISLNTGILIGAAALMYGGIIAAALSTSTSRPASFSSSVLASRRRCAYRSGATA